MKTPLEILKNKFSNTFVGLEEIQYSLCVEAMIEYAMQEVKNLNLPVVIHWVAVADEIPPENKKVICWNGYRMVEQSWMQYTGSDEEWFRKTFTHWTPDVKPPCL